MGEIKDFGEWSIFYKDIKDFKEDDIVVNINTHDRFFGKIGIITEPLKTLSGRTISFKIVFSDNSVSQFYGNDFRLATEEEIEKYHLETNTNKYNL